MGADVSREDLAEARKATRIALAKWRRRLWMHSDYTDGDKLIGTIMCDEYFNIDTAQLNPSLPTFAAISGGSVRGAKKHVDRLKQGGSIGWSSGKGRSSSSYVLLDDTGTAIPGSLERLGQTKTTGTGTTVLGSREHSFQPWRETGTLGPGRLEQPGTLSGTPVPPNLLLNLESNLTGLAIFERLKPHFGSKTKLWLWKDAVIAPGNMIIFAKRVCYQQANDLHGMQFHEAAITTSWRGAA